MTELMLAIAIGVLYASGLYLMMRRSIARFIIGLALLSHGANLLIFTAGGLSGGRAPIIPEGSDAPAGLIADPLPQALILTAIVISFALLAFALVLLLRTHQETETDDMEKLRSTDA
ncbi:MAG TPA: Na+/H+ antiporter subunit C [Kiritimatiellia bacterium]|nr:Na+/H+ antiporter subunit C [Kiritimatiellia bacterium]HMO99261.1 Na+/H+ antiporter subunit C [Kiritimatiellia bacterium]HMP96947.1 Na+/H+ antiporter subunit C [Kiritimatiellia bacterium]